MKIIHITHYYQPQLGYQEYNLAKKQKEQGHEVTIITSNKLTPFLNYNLTQGTTSNGFTKMGKFTEEGIAVFRLSTPIELKRRMWLLGLESLVTKLKPDVIHVHGIFNETAWRIARLKEKLGFNLIYDSHMHRSIYKRNRIYMKLYHSLFKTFFLPKILKESDIFVGTCEETKQLIFEEYSIPNNRIIVIPLGADIDLFKRDEKQRKIIREKLNIKPKEIVLIYAGKLTPGKAPHLLLDSCVNIIKKYKKIKLLFVGNVVGNELTYVLTMKKKVIRNKIEKNVIFHKAVSNKELFKYYSAADIGVWPAMESFTMIEAAATGLPIIIKKSEAMGKRVSNRNGLMYPEGNVQELSESIIKLLKNKKLMMYMGERSRELVEKKFSWDNIADKFIQVYKNPKRFVK